MKPIRAVLMVGAVIIVSTLTFGTNARASEMTNNSTSSDGFTAVAGTDTVVMDKRAKNDIALLSAFMFAIAVLLAFGALKHARSKLKDEPS